jgi:hypothetical protein
MYSEGKGRGSWAHQGLAGERSGKEAGSITQVLRPTVAGIHCITVENAAETKRLQSKKWPSSSLNPKEIMCRQVFFTVTAQWPHGQLIKEGSGT